MVTPEYARGPTRGEVALAKAQALHRRNLKILAVTGVLTLLLALAVSLVVHFATEHREAPPVPQGRAAETLAVQVHPGSGGSVTVTSLAPKGSAWMASVDAPLVVGALPRPGVDRVTDILRTQTWNGLATGPHKVFTALQGKNGRVAGPVATTPFRILGLEGMWRGGGTEGNEGEDAFYITEDMTKVTCETGGVVKRAAGAVGALSSRVVWDDGSTMTLPSSSEEGTMGGSTYTRTAGSEGQTRDAVETALCAALSS